MAIISLPGEFHGQRSLVSYSPRACKELDMTEVTEDACTHTRSEISYCMCFLPSGLNDHDRKDQVEVEGIKLPLWPSYLEAE